MRLFGMSSEERAHYQRTTWKRTDIPVQVICGTSRGIVEHRFPDLAEAQKQFPSLTLGQGMRGHIRDYNTGEVIAEYALRFEIGCDFGGD